MAKSLVRRGLQLVRRSGIAEGGEHLRDFTSTRDDSSNGLKDVQGPSQKGGENSDHRANWRKQKEVKPKKAFKLNKARIKKILDYVHGNGSNPSTVHKRNPRGKTKKKVKVKIRESKVQKKAEQLAKFGIKNILESD